MAGISQNSRMLHFELGIPMAAGRCQTPIGQGGVFFCQQRKGKILQWVTVLLRQIFFAGDQSQR